MNSSKIISFIFLFICLLAFKNKQIFAVTNTFNDKLNYALSNLNVIPDKTPTCFPNLGFCRLEITNNKSKITTLISTTIDPYFQIASFQQILKTATMKNKHAEFIDLSSPRPYATLKDN